MRMLFAAVLVVHGLIHIMGFAKAFGLAQLPQLSLHISKPVGLLWLLAGVLCGACAFVPLRWLWPLGLLTVALSQALVVTAWHDAKFGSLANLVLLLAAAYSLLATGPWSFARAYADDSTSELARVSPQLRVVSEADLLQLPAPVQRYLRVTGTLGQPRVVSFRARWQGRIREKAGDPWMPFVAEQLNTLPPSAATRMFFMQATMKGLPVDVYHRFIAEAATFRVRLLSALQIVSAQGEELSRSETVTILNDLCLLAPSALLDPSMAWEASGEDWARVRFTRAAQTVRAELRFNAAGELSDFISDDRSRSSADGKSFERLRWSTPIQKYQTFEGHHLAARAQAQWHENAHDPADAYAYGEFELLGIQYNVTP